MSTQSSKVGSVAGNSIGCSGSGESKGKGTLHGFVSSEPRQTTLNSTYKKDLRVDVKRRVVHFIYSAVLPFNVVNDPYWLPMVESIAEYGRGFKPPSMHELRTWILKVESMYNVKRPLEQMFASEDWVSSPLSQTTQGKVVKRIVINDPNFWPHVAFCVKSVVPLIKAAISAIRYPSEFPRFAADIQVTHKKTLDMFDLLEFVFGFQVSHAGDVLCAS
ncbi:hypothetical protein ZIOFF_035793 [Zingiber officinale]|uniref:Uncharacterized protein n=1 Tax=Zingiber officinale TaxID=94328 RepID=A0A8J5G9N2_ZINOF|nr:hypothetical protein ZIOFF_035793 [Zingiber officinale]